MDDQEFRRLTRMDDPAFKRCLIISMTALPVSVLLQVLLLPTGPSRGPIEWLGVFVFVATWIVYAVIRTGRSERDD